MKLRTHILFQQNIIALLIIEETESSRKRGSMNDIKDHYAGK